MKTGLCIVWAMILAGLVMWILGLTGCATFEYCDSDVTIKTATLGKDIVIDPNGVMSTVSPKNQGIIEAILGGIAGFLIAH